MEKVKTWQRPNLGWKIWLTVFLVAHSLDVVTTAIGIRSGLAEANPLMAYILSHSELAMYGMKLVLVSVFALIVFHLRTRFTALWMVFRVVTLIVLVVAGTNLMQAVLGAL